MFLFVNNVLNIPILSFYVGKFIYINKSKRPDRSNAGSTFDKLFVAAITTIFSFFIKPSISFNNSFIVDDIY